MADVADDIDSGSVIGELRFLLGMSYDKKSLTLAGHAAKAASLLDTLAIHLRDPYVRDNIGKEGGADIVAKIVGQSAAVIADPAVREAETALLFQAARVAGNLAADCDKNRDRLAAKEYPARIVAVLEANLKLPEEERFSVQTHQAIAASLMNLTTAGHAASVAALDGHDTFMTLARTSNSLYMLGQWTDPDFPLRATIASWYGNVIAHAVGENPTYKLSLSSLGVFTEILSAFVSLRSMIKPSLGDDDIEEHYSTDVAVLTSAIKVLERFNAKDQLEYAQILGSEEAVGTLLTFMEKATEPDWLDMSEWEDADELKKSLGVAKADVSRTVVSILSEGVEGGKALPKWAMERLGEWLEITDRPDLVSVALLAYGNCARGDAAATDILTSNPSLLGRLVTLLSPSTPIIVQHALVGLLRNLAIPVPNKRVLGDADVIPRLVAMKPWDEQRDMLGSVQGGAVGIVKQLVRDEGNALQLLADPKGGPEDLHALVARTNDPAIALEATRVWVNCARALGGSGRPKAPELAAAWSVLADGRVLDELVAMLTQGAKYPVLLNEAVLAFTLISSFGPDGVKREVAARLVDEEKAKQAQQDHPTAGLEGKSGAQVIAGVIAGSGGQSAKETQQNAVTLVRLLGDDRVNKVVGTTDL